MKINLNYYFDNILRCSHRKKNNKSNFKIFVNVFDYLSTHCIKFKFIIISSTIFAFNTTLLTFAIKQNNVLFIFFNNIKKA